MKRIFINIFDYDPIPGVQMESFCKESIEVKNEELASTCKMMVSHDYKERFKAEVIQLRNRLNGLTNMLAKWDKGELDFTPTCPRELYDVQVDAMTSYLITLTNRARIEDISIDD